MTPEAEAERRAAQRGGYLAFVAHEMRNPLSTALWSAELLARLSPEERAGPRGEKLAGMCLRTLSRLRHLVEDHFLAERLAVHGLPIRLDAVRLHDALATALGRVPQAQFALDLEGSPVLEVDRAMLERALEALVACSAREDTSVSVSAREIGGVVEVTFRGAKPETNAFATPDRSTPSDPTGRALGLLMARAVAESHGGWLGIEQECFVLRLPAAGSERVSDSDPER